MDHKRLLQVIWLCALLFNGCFSTPKEYRYRGQSQNANIGDDEHDERLVSSTSEAEDGDQKPAAQNTPTRGSSQRNMQPRPGGQAVQQLSSVAQGSKANEPLFPLSGPANVPLGAANQQSTATGFRNAMLPSSSGGPDYAPQSAGQSQLVSDSQAPEAKGFLFEDVFHFQDSGPAHHYGAGRGYDYGLHSQNFGSQGSTFETRMPFSERYAAQPAGHFGVVYGNLVPISYNEGLNSNLEETVPQGANGLVMPPPPPSYNPVYLTQSRHAYSRARYTHSHSKYSPDLDAPMPATSVDPLPVQDVPVVRKEPQRAKW